MANPSPMVVAASVVSKELNADVYLYSSSIDRDNAKRFCRCVNLPNPRRENAFVILSTNGGDPDAAYLIASALKRNYKKVTLAIFSLCKSAGTLVAICADELVMGDAGELGPLDIQVGKDDELFKRGSGLDLSEAIRYLKDLSWDLFFDNFAKLKAGTNITTKTAAEISERLAQAIIEPIANQIDPLKLGEMQRSLVIARRYGELLNPKFEGFDKLITGYPSHSFVIDREQAEKLFKVVRKPSIQEMELANTLAYLLDSSRDTIWYFPPIPPDTAHEKPASDGNPAAAAGSATGDGQ